MISSISTFCLILVTVELLMLGSVAGFFQQKINVKVILRLLLASTSIFATIIFGKQLGLWGYRFFPDYSMWYGSSILFVLSLKYMYDGLRMKKIKSSINPLDNQGLFVFLYTMGINGMFLGIAFGLFQLDLSINLYAFISTIVFVLIGFLIGTKMKKLIAIRYELIISILLLTSTIIIVTNS